MENDIYAGSLPELLLGIGIVFFVWLILFLLIRELVCWYYKINKQVDLMREQNKLLRELIDINKSNSNKINPNLSEDNYKKYGPK